jgi:hypothetical protein
LIALPFVGDMIKTVISEGTLRNGITDVVYLLALVFAIAYLVFAGQFSLHYFITLRKLIATIENPKVNRGQSVNFQIRITSSWFSLTSGFIKIVIVDPHLKKTRFYDYPSSQTEPKHGDLNGWYQGKEASSASWRVPNDASEGEYTVHINACGRQPNPFFILQMKTYRLKSQTLKFTVLPSPKEKVEILQPSKCGLRNIPAIDLRTLPAKGGIRLKVHNSEAIEYRDCTGRVITGDGNEEFELIDYREYLNTNSHGNNDMILYTIFDIPANSDKLLFAEVKTDDGRIKVSLDIGKDTVEKEFRLV